MSWLLLSALAWSSPDQIVLRPSPGASARPLPQTRPDLIQWTVRDNQVPLFDQLPTRPGEGVLDVGVVSLGSGVWVVSAWLDPADPRVPSVGWEGPDLVLHIHRGEAELLPVQPGPSLEELLADQVAPLSRGAPSTSLQPLGGSAWALRLRPEQLRLGSGDWEPNLIASDRALLVRDDSPRGIDRQRQALTGTDDPYVKAAALFRLGQAHQSLGLYREAAYYFDRVVEHPAAWPAATVALRRAQASLTVGRGDQAREHCAEAAQARVRDEQVLECLGMVALETQDPPPGPTGRALAASTARPDALLLAGQLLLLDGRPGEAHPLLEAAADGLPDGELRDAAFASLGDACFYLHEGDQARAAWAEVAAGDLGQLVWLRKRMLMLSDDGPRSWAAGIPDLYGFAGEGGVLGAESLYLIAQIGSGLGDLDQSVEVLVRLVDEHAREIQGSDVGQRLWRGLSERLLQLHRTDRRVELLALWRERWRRSLVPHVSDTEAVEIVAEAYRGLGLSEEALRVQRTIFEIQTRRGEVEVESLVQLAELYQLTGRGEDALRTLEFARSEGLPRSLAGRALLLEGQVQVDLEQPERALMAWRRAAMVEDVADEASARMALLDGSRGRCDRAVPALRSLTKREPLPASLIEGEGHMLLAACLLEQGRSEEASLAAREGAGRASDEVSRRYGTWLAAEGAREAGVQEPLLQAALDGDQDLWAALGRESERDRAFRSAITDRKQR